MNASSILEIPILPEKLKPKKHQFFEDPHKYFSFDFRTRTAVFIDSNSMLCLLNTFFKTRKFFQVDERLRIKDIYIIPQYSGNNNFFEAIVGKKMSDDELLKKGDNMYRYLEDYPDFDFRVCLITQDGFIIVLSNEASFNEVHV